VIEDLRIELEIDGEYLQVVLSRLDYFGESRISVGHLHLSKLAEALASLPEPPEVKP
jgi:hypothetical protein